MSWARAGFFMGMFLVSCLELHSSPARANEVLQDSSLRSKRWELMLSPEYALTKNLGFEGGTTAKVNDTWGFGLQIGYNFDAHWNLAGFFSWTRPDYQAVAQPAPGTSGPPRQVSGSLQMNTFGMAVTYNLLAQPLTPYIEGLLAGTYINTDIAAGPPVLGCYWYPWWGYVCGASVPTKSDTFLNYGLGGGLRWDVTEKLLMRAGARYQWIDISHTGVPGFTMIKLDFGFKF